MAEMSEKNKKKRRPDGKSKYHPPPHPARTEEYSPRFGRIGGDNRVDSQLVGEILERLHGRSFHFVIVGHGLSVSGRRRRWQKREGKILIIKTKYVYGWLRRNVRFGLRT